MEAKAKLSQMLIDLNVSENKRKEALRIQQIKEEALAKTEEEKQALLQEHRRELARLNEGYAERTREIQGSIERDKRQVEQMTGQLMGMLASNAKLIGDTAIANRQKGINQKNRESRAASKFAERSVKEYIMPDKKRPGAKAAADPLLDNPDMGGELIEVPVVDPSIAAQRSPVIDEPDDEALPEPITSNGKKHGGNCGMSNFQIDAAMEDEPMYLKTISADQIPELYIMANLALDEYKQCGFIVNTDPLGVVETQHWTAVYIDCDDENILYYYDSFGDPPTPLIAAGLRALIRKLDIPHYLAFEYNNVVNQNISSNRCGVHCILTLTELFSGMSTDLAASHGEGAAKAFQQYI